MGREAHIEAIVSVFPFERKPTEQAVANLRKFLGEKHPRRLKRMRRQLEEALRNKTRRTK